MTDWLAEPPLDYRPAGGVATGGEVWDATRDANILVRNQTAKGVALEKAYDDRIAAIKAATGVELQNPTRAPARPLARGPAALNGFVDPFDRFRADLDRLAEAHPDKAEAIGAGRRVDMVEAARAVSRDAEKRAGEALGSRGDLVGYAAAFGGGFAGSLRDPLQTAALFAGGGLGGGATVAARILSTAGREALVNAGIEAALQPVVQNYRAEIGLEAGLGEAAKDVAMAAAFGGAFGAAARGGGEAISALARRYGDRLTEAPAEVRGAAAAVEAEDATEAMRPTLRPDATPADAARFDTRVAAAVDAAEDPAAIAAATRNDPAATTLAKAKADPSRLSSWEINDLLAAEIDGATPIEAFRALATVRDDPGVVRARYDSEIAELEAATPAAYLTPADRAAGRNIPYGMGVITEAERAAKLDELRAGRDAPEPTEAERLKVFALGDDAVTIRELGPLGPVAEGFDGRWREAVTWLRHWKGGEALGALEHPDVGRIDVVWGRQPAGSDTGFGLAHIIAKHPEVVDDLPTIVAGLKVESRSANRVILASADHRAVVRLAYDAEAKTWLVSAYETGRRRGGSTTVRPAGRQKDTSSFSPAEDSIAQDGVSANPRAEIADALREAGRGPDPAAVAALDDTLPRRAAAFEPSEGEAQTAELLAGFPEPEKIALPEGGTLAEALDALKREDGIANLVAACRTEG